MHLSIEEFLAKLLQEFGEEGFTALEAKAIFPEDAEKVSKRIWDLSQKSELIKRVTKKRPYLYKVGPAGRQRAAMVLVNDEEISVRPSRVETGAHGVKIVHIEHPLPLDMSTIQKYYIEMGAGLGEISRMTKVWEKKCRVFMEDRGVKIRTRHEQTQLATSRGIQFVCDWEGKAPAASVAFSPDGNPLASTTSSAPSPNGAVSALKYILGDRFDAWLEKQAQEYMRKLIHLAANSNI